MTSNSSATLENKHRYLIKDASYSPMNAKDALLAESKS